MPAQRQRPLSTIPATCKSIDQNADGIARQQTTNICDVLLLLWWYVLVKEVVYPQLKGWTSESDLQVCEQTGQTVWNGPVWNRLQGWLFICLNKWLGKGNLIRWEANWAFNCYLPNEWQKMWTQRTSHMRMKKGLSESGPLEHAITWYLRMPWLTSLLYI